MRRTVGTVGKRNVGKMNSHQSTSSDYFVTDLRVCHLCNSSHVRVLTINIKGIKLMVRPIALRSPECSSVVSVYWTPESSSGNPTLPNIT